MDIVHKMRLHASVDQLCVDDINASNIHGMLQFAREACFSIKKFNRRLRGTRDETNQTRFSKRSSESVEAGVDFSERRTGGDEVMSEQTRGKDTRRHRRR